MGAHDDPGVRKRNGRRASPAQRDVAFCDEGRRPTRCGGGRTACRRRSSGVDGTETMLARPLLKGTLS